MNENNQYQQNPQYQQQYQEPQYQEPQYQEPQYQQNPYGQNAYAAYHPFELAYVGKNADKILPNHNKKNAFSWTAAFLGTFYFLYRKLYVEALIASVAMSAITALLGALNISYLGTIVSLLAYGFAFYPLYFRKMENKLQGCMNEAQAAQAGGTNIALPIVLGALFVLGIFVLVFAFFALFASFAF